ncbi:F-box/kelch-repeat protein At3g06240-like [Bidens hawaiensis]|uniref:F-box/kelch-repeat protein At3g06240-like n=1 Tax=Bidens hawaiensis TaxID=980011 RepID=UPI00404AD3C1
MAAELPSESIYDILSRLPVKSLARFRCVSKLWRNYINDPYLETMHAKRAVIDDPILVTFRQFVPDHPPNCTPCTLVSFLEYKKEESTSTLEMRKKPPALEFMCGIEDYRYRDDMILGSCNGLLYSSQDTTLIVIHPLKKECYELPQIIITQHPKSSSWHWWHIRKSIESSCGLGFDDSTNTFKMVCVVPSESEDVLYTMVHVLGTDSWRQIPQVPSTIINGEGVFINGCLHWLPKDDSSWQVITFEMKTEEFGWIKPPRETVAPTEWIDVHLVNLHGQLGFVYNSSMEMWVWVLKDRGWLMHCQFEQKRHEYGHLKVLGFWNAKGDILVINKKNRGLYVYNLKSRSLCEVSFKGLQQGRVKDTRMYQSSLFTTRYTIEENPKEKTLA